jgi:hypothetical protein
MNFYFCETCGKRITDVDLERGAGRDKKLKGVYCSGCAVGVMTMEMDAITDEKLKRAANKDIHQRATGEMDSLPTEEPRRVNINRTSGRVPVLKPSDVKPTTHASAARITPARKIPASTTAKPKNNLALILGAGSVVVILIAVLILMGTNKPVADGKKIAAVETAKKPSPAQAEPTVPEAVPAQTKIEPPAPKIDKAVAATSAPIPANPETKVESATTAPHSLFAEKGEDIRESIAKGKLDEIEQLNKDGKLTPQQLRAKYAELTESSYKSTKAGMRAAEALKALPPPVEAAVVTPAAPVPPAVPTPPVTPVAPAAPHADSTAKPIPAASVVTGKHVWWEGEDAIEHNFVSHLWLAEQLDKSNLSGGKYLNQLFDEKWIRQNGKTPTNNLHAKWIVDVPADATYTLWSREYDAFCGVLWKFRWDDGKWFSVTADYPSENKVEIGKDRPLCWRNFPNQTLKKGKHTFYLEATIEGIHNIAGFDCFYLTTDPFKPDGAKKP